MSTFAPPADAALPSLACALDGAHMASIFDHAWHDTGVSIEQAALEQAKYRPGRNATFVYRLKGRHGEQPIEWLAAGRLSQAADAAGRCTRYQAQRQVAEAAAPFAHDTLGFFGWRLPDDPKLPTLPAMLAPETHRAALGLASPPRLTHLRYVAESRACVRVDGVDGPLAYAKLDRDPAQGGHGHALLTALARTLGAHPAIRVPRPLAVDMRTGLQWQSVLPGTPLTIEQMLHDAPLAQALGTLLATLHQVPLTPARSAPNLSADTTLRCRQLAHSYPRLAGRIERIHQTLHRHAPLLPADACLHGDLHPGNILIDAGRPGLIDLDGAHRGSALAELGHWGAHLHTRTLDQDAPAHHANSALANLIEAYQRATGRAVDARALSWAVARALVAERAYRVLTRLRPGGEPLVTQLVEAAQAMLSRSVPATPAGAPPCV